MLTSWQGFYRPNQIPVFPQGMLVKTHNVAPGVKCRLRTPVLVIIEFILEDVVDMASAGQMMFLSLAANYTAESRKNIHHEKIVFDLKSDSAIVDHSRSVSLAVQKLKGLYVFAPPPPPSLSRLTFMSGTPSTTRSSLFTPILMMTGVISGSLPWMMQQRQLLL